MKLDMVSIDRTLERARKLTERVYFSGPVAEESWRVDAKRMMRHLANLILELELEVSIAKPRIKKTKPKPLGPKPLVVIQQTAVRC